MLSLRNPGGSKKRFVVNLKIEALEVSEGTKWHSARGKSLPYRIVLLPYRTVLLPLPVGNVAALCRCKGVVFLLLTMCLVFVKLAVSITYRIVLLPLPVGNVAALCRCKGVVCILLTMCLVFVKLAVSTAMSKRASPRW